MRFIITAMGALLVFSMLALLWHETPVFDFFHLTVNIAMSLCSVLGIVAIWRMSE